MTPAYRRSPFLRAVAHLTTGNLGATALMFLLVILLPKKLTAADYGYWQLYLLYATYLGYLTFGITEGIYLRFSGSPLSAIPRRLIATHIGALILLDSIAVAALAALSWPLLGEHQWTYLALAGLGTIFYAARNAATMVYQAANNMALYSRIFIGERALMVALVLIAVAAGHTNPLLLVSADVIAKALGMLTAISIIFSNRDLGREATDTSGALTQLRTTINGGFFLNISAFLAVAVTAVVRLGIERNFGVATFGQVALVISLVGLFQTVASSIGQAVLPNLRRSAGTNLAALNTSINRRVAPYLGAVIAAAIPLIVFVSFWLPEHQQLPTYILLLSPLGASELRNRLLSVPFLQALRKERLIAAVNVTAFLASLAWIAVAAGHFGNVEATILALPVILAIRTIIMDAAVHRALGTAPSPMALVESGFGAVTIAAAYHHSPHMACLIIGAATGAYILLVSFVRTHKTSSPAAAAAQPRSPHSTTGAVTGLYTRRAPTPAEFPAPTPTVGATPPTQAPAPRRRITPPRSLPTNAMLLTSSVVLLIIAALIGWATVPGRSVLVLACLTLTAASARLWNQHRAALSAWAAMMMSTYIFIINKPLLALGGDVTRDPYDLPLYDQSRALAHTWVFLLGLHIAAATWARRRAHTRHDDTARHQRAAALHELFPTTQKLLTLGLILASIASLAANLDAYAYVRAHGYAAYYASYHPHLPTVVAYLALLVRPLLLARLAFFPRARAAALAIGIVMISMGPRLAMGRRGDLVALLLLIGFYALISTTILGRNHWSRRLGATPRTRRRAAGAILATLTAGGLALAWLFDTINYQRFDTTASTTRWFDRFFLTRLLYDQAVTYIVIGRGLSSGHNFYAADEKNYALGSLLDQIRHGSWAQLLTGAKELGHNNLDVVEYGNSFADDYGLYYYPQQFLAGRGSGSSVIVEFGLTYGLVGVLIAGLALGALLIAMTTRLSGIWVTNTILLLPVFDVFFIARSTSFQFLLLLFSAHFHLIIIGTALLCLLEYYRRAPEEQGARHEVVHLADGEETITRLRRLRRTRQLPLRRTITIGGTSSTLSPLGLSPTPTPTPHQATSPHPAPKTQGLFTSPTAQHHHDRS